MASRVVAVCLQKSGTHLLAQVLASFGLRVCGAVRPNPTVPYSRIPFTREDEDRILLHAGPMVRTWAAFLKVVAPKSRAELYYTVWSDVFWSWRERMGVPLRSRYDQHTWMQGRKSADRYSKIPFSATPNDLAWFLPSLSVSRLDGAFVQEWTAQKDPVLIFNIRDPRDMLLSFVDYLLGKTKYGPGTYREYMVYGEILRNLRNYHDQILFAIRDPLFPGKLATSESMWLLRHPAVLTVRYEDIAGAGSGGSHDKQAEALAAIGAHIGRECRFDKMRRDIANKDTFTFFKGKMHRWREEFSSRHIDEYKSRYDRELSALGYSW
jgi:hypothetical protein